MAPKHKPEKTQAIQASKLYNKHKSRKFAVINGCPWQPWESSFKRAVNGSIVEKTPLRKKCQVGMTLCLVFFLVRSSLELSSRQSTGLFAGWQGIVQFLHTAFDSCNLQLFHLFLKWLILEVGRSRFVVVGFASL